MTAVSTWEPNRGEIGGGQHTGLGNVRKKGLGLEVLGLVRRLGRGGGGGSVELLQTTVH